MHRPNAPLVAPSDAAATDYSGRGDAERRERNEILVIRHGAFGDLIQADGALRDIRRHHHGAWIALLVAPQYARLMARCPHVDEVVSDPRAPPLHLWRNLALIRQLIHRRFSHVYDLQGSDRTGLYRKLLGAGFWSRKQNPDSSQTPDRLAYAEQLRRADVPVVRASDPDVDWMADDVSALLATAGIAPGYFVLIPGSATRHQDKRWPHYAELAHRLNELGRQVVYVPGPDELELVKELPGKALLGPDGSFLNWFQLAGVLRDAGFVIGNDTGPTHLAACLGRPGLALFGPRTNATRTGLRYGDFGAVEAADLKQLTPAQVLEAIAQRIAL
ncbi:glycosyltransferase family 9 protein [Lysobacter tyrosinilyticus]